MSINYINGYTNMNLDGKIIPKNNENGKDPRKPREKKEIFKIRNITTHLNHHERIP